MSFNRNKMVTNYIVIYTITGLCLLLAWCSKVSGNSHLFLESTYTIDDTNGVGRTYDGIGAISGGSATSKLLVNYPQKQRDQILDILFKPDYGASLQILKVEIGGDSHFYNAEGVEATHMRNESDLNFHRGYEWWMIKEAKKRNPDIKLYGLPWMFPAWLAGPGRHDPYFNKTKLVTYILNWVKGAHTVHELNISYLGIWNERPYDIEYIGMLRQALNSAGFSHIKIVAADGASWQIVKDYLNHTILQKSVDILGFHYPGTYSPAYAQNLSVPLWASEEYSTYNNISGGGCWARVLSESYVKGVFTGVIAWNLIASYYDHLPYTRNSLMTANEPWSGHYEVSSPVWITAHHTHFNEIGWNYLKNNSGSGALSGGGTYVAYTSNDHQDLTLVIETMDPATSPCFYHTPSYPVAEVQEVVFVFKGSFKNIAQLNVWHSKLEFEEISKSSLFKRQESVKMINNTIHLKLYKNEVYTLTTLKSNFTGKIPNTPNSSAFPQTYKDNFDVYEVGQEPYNLMAQSGLWEVYQSSDEEHGKAIQQVVLKRPIQNCNFENIPPVAVIGNHNWTDSDVQVDIRFLKPEDNGARGIALGVRVFIGGCDMINSSGVFLWLFAFNNSIGVTNNFNHMSFIKLEKYNFSYETWYTVRLQVVHNRVTVYLDNSPVVLATLKSGYSQNGFVALATSEFGTAQYDNLNIAGHI